MQDDDGGGVPATHTLAGVIWFSLPAGALVYLAFQQLLRRPAWFLLPALLRTRLDPEPRIGAPVSVALCLVLGALSHVAWDAFTHDAHGGHADLTHTLLQYGSTALGALVLCAALALWYRRATPRPLPVESGAEAALRRAGRLAIVAAPGAVGLAAALLLAPPVHDAASFVWFLVHVLVAGFTTAVLVVAGLAFAPTLRGRGARA